MRILIIVDKYQSAIDRLAQPLVEHLNYLDIKIMPVHPKRPSTEQLYEAQQLMKWADIIDIHYWRSGEVLKNHFPDEFNEKPKLLCHFNPYDVEQQKWLDTYNMVVVGNETIQAKVPYAKLIPYCIDLNFWKWNQKYTEEKVVNMCVARIEGKKGVREVAEACKRLKYQFNLVGRVSNDQYMRDVLAAGGDYIKFYENITDAELRDKYYQSAVHVCNSVDDFESGTLPILESMACGLPVLTRSVGHVPDLFDGKNMVINNEKPENVDNLVKLLKELMENKEWRLKIRESAWQTVKNRNVIKMAREFSKTYFKLRNEKPLVSIIIPTYDNHEALVQSMAHAVTQKYENIEIVIADSGKRSSESIVRKFRLKTNTPIKYIRFEAKGEYTLPKARNLAVLESQGEYLVFCDDRIAMSNDSVLEFMEEASPLTWLWGTKDDSPKAFVENFSCVRREDLITFGGFNERIDSYGGATQDIRARFEKRAGFTFKHVPKAKAVGIKKSSSRWTRKHEIVQSKLKLYKLYGN